VTRFTTCKTKQQSNKIAQHAFLAKHKIFSRRWISNKEKESSVMFRLSAV